MLPTCHCSSTVRCQRPRSLLLCQGFAPTPVVGGPGLQATHWVPRASLALCTPEFTKAELGVDVAAMVGGGCREVFGQSGFGTSQEERVASYPHGHSGHQTVCQGWPPAAELKKPVPLGLPRQPLREAHQPLPALRTAKLQLPPRSGSRAGTSSPLAGGNNLLDASPLSFHLPKPKTNQKGKQKTVLICSLFLLVSSIYFCSTPFSKPDAGEKIFPLGLGLNFSLPIPVALASSLSCPFLSPEY